MTVLRLDQVTCGYGSAPIDTQVNLEAREGQITALVGPNGAGKSTLLKAAAGLLRLMEGRIELAGKDVSGLPPHRIVEAGMAYVPQVSNVFPRLTVIENLEMGAYTMRGDPRPRIDEVFGVFPDLRPAASRRAGVLSGGQRNMLAMARALMLDPKVLLLDEPTGGLAPVYVERVWETATRIAATGTAVVVVEQNVDLALVHANWVYVLVAGRNYLDGSAVDVAKADLASIFLGKPDASEAANAVT
jgi:ABC-type branched-subunit amino acid transport system ATPase component